MKKIYTARNPVDANLLKGVLEAEGIDALVQGEFLWIARGEVPLTSDTAPSVWVTDDADYEEAMELVKEFQPSENPDSPEVVVWKCHHCKETNEEQFTECWNCGTPRSES